jgi:glycosidase
VKGSEGLKTLFITNFTSRTEGIKQRNIMKEKRSLFIALALVAVVILGACSKEDTMIAVDPPEQEPVPQQYGTPFNSVPAIADIQLYEVNPRVFSPEKNLDGISARLDDLQQLGVNVVWLMPIYQTGSVKSVGSPYAVKDYWSIHSDYGNLEDLRELVDKAHALDMAVMLDWVANHTAWDNAWISNKSWYAQDGAGQIIHPPGTNWQDVAELNYDNTEMRQEMIKAMKYWILEANVDGYRCDFASGVPPDFWRQAIDTLRSIPDRELILFAESGDKSLLNAGFDLIFGWSFYGKLREVFNGQPAEELYSAHQNEYSGLAADEHIVRWITNHDEHAWDATPESIFGGIDAAMAAFVLASHMGGAPLVYNGQEVSAPNQLPFFEGNNVTINWNLNPAVKAEYERVLNYRRESEAIRKGSLEDFSSTDVAAFKRKLGTEEVLVIVNVRDFAIDNSPLPAAIANTTWHNAYDDSEAPLAAAVSLEAYEYLILKNK